MMKKIIFFFVITNYLLFAQQYMNTDHKKFDFDCQTCHLCEKPTKKNPCLSECPRFDLITVHHLPEEGPDIVVMDEKYNGEDLYESVKFSHKLHAEMSGMSGGCSMCHHFNPPGNILPCRNCHDINRSRRDITKPDLKGAYHRQCMNCHREWGHSTDCNSCHILHGSGISDGTVSENSKPNQGHANIIEPKQMIFRTSYNRGKIVTFYHNEHIELFGLECTDCHSNESCVKCHEVKNLAYDKKVSLNEYHNICSECHQTNDESNCSPCHSTEIAPSFNHEVRTSFTLVKFHKSIACQNCHKVKSTFSGLDSECKSCHNNWEQSNFNHKITGFVLDENHIENDCEDCHLDNKYAEKPSCENCHDEDGVSFPGNLPGKRILLSKEGDSKSKNFGR